MVWCGVLEVVIAVLVLLVQFVWWNAYDAGY